MSTAFAASTLLAVSVAVVLGFGTSPATAATSSAITSATTSPAALAPTDPPDDTPAPSRTPDQPDPTPTEPAPSDPTPSDPARPADPADPTDPVAPPPTPTQPEPPIITSPSSDELTTGTFTVAGTGSPGSTLQILPAASSEPLCIVDAADDGAWSCAVSGLASSPSTTLRVIELVPGGSDVQSTVTVRVLTAPTVAGGPRGTLTNGVVLGTAFAGATVSASTVAGSTGAHSCEATADASGAWTCPLGDGITDGAYEVTATQATGWSSGTSSPAAPAIAVQVDVSVPTAPVVLSPAPSARLPLSGAAFSGSGETGATVSVFAGAQVLCDAVVADSAWACSGGTVPAGDYTVSVLQQDLAGNVSVQSRPLRVRFQDVAIPATPPGNATPAPTPGRSTVPGAPAPADAGSPGAPDGSDAPADAPPSQGGADSADPGQSSGDALGESGASGAPQGTWADATRFTAALQPALGAGSSALWWAALAIAALALVLIALPARLLAGTVGSLTDAAPERTARHRVLSRITGRNRARVEFDRAPEVTFGPIGRIAIVLLASAALVTLSVPVLGQPAYLRLFLASVAGLALVSLAATALPLTIGRAVFGIVGRVRIDPRLLLVSAAAALVSRSADLHPALVFGLIGGVALAGTAARADRGRLATVQVLCLLVLGSTSWLVAGAVGTGAANGDMLAAAFAEFSSVVVLASFGSASMLLLPIGHGVGRRLLDWSPATWALLSVAAFSALAMLFVPSIAAAAPAGGLLTPLLVVIGFAAVSVSAWAWVKFVAADVA